MKASLAKQNGTYFWFNWTWNQRLGGFFLILLGCLNLIWPLPTLIIVASLLVLVCFVIRPYIAFVVTTFLIGFDAFSITYFSQGYAYAYGPCYYMAVLGIICWCLSRLAGVSPPYQSTTLDLPLAVLYISCLIALLWTPFLQDGVHIVYYTTMGYALYLLASAVNTTPHDLERFFWLWFWLGILTILTTFATLFSSWLKMYHIYDQFYLRIYVTQFIGTRITLNGTMGAGAKAIAALLNVSILCGLTLLCTQVRRTPRVLIFFSLLLMLLLHFMTLSRLETMGLLLGWLAFAHLNPQWRNARMLQHLRAAACVLIVLLALFALLSQFSGARELFARLTAQEQTVGYRFSGTQNRWDHIVVALEGIWETAGLGDGTGGIMRRLDPSVWVDSPSLYFSFLTDHGYGILSLMLMGWIMINLIVELRWALLNCSDPRFKIFIVGVCSILFMFGNPFGDQFFFIFQMWVVLGLAVTAVKAVRYLGKTAP